MHPCAVRIVYRVLCLIQLNPYQPVAYRSLSTPNTAQDVFLEKHGVKLGFMSVFVKAAAYALQVGWG